MDRRNDASHNLLRRSWAEVLSDLSSASGDTLFHGHQRGSLLLVEASSCGTHLDEDVRVVNSNQAGTLALLAIYQASSSHPVLFSLCGGQENRLYVCVHRQVQVRQQASEVMRRASA